MEPTSTRSDRGLPAAVAQFVTALALSIGAGAVIASSGDWQIAAGMLAGSMLVAFGMLRPALFLCVLLALRPLLDGIPASASGVVGVVLIGVCALVLAGREPMVRPRATPAFAALLTLSALGALVAWSNFPSIVGLKPLTELVRLSALFAIYLLAAQIATTPEMMKRILLVVGLSGVLPALDGLNELASNPEKIASLNLVRVSGTFVNPVALSAYLALTLLILLSLPRADVKGWVRWPAVAVMTAALVASYGREGWGLLLIGIVVLHWRDNKRAIAAVAITCASLLLALPGVRERVLPSAPTMQLTDRASTFASYDFRLANWRGLLGRYAERPLTGWGLQTTVVVNPRRPFGSQRRDGGGFQAHNGAVRALVEGGVQLLIAVLTLLGMLIAAMYRIARIPDSPMAPYARIAGAAWIGMLVVAVTTDDLLDATALVYALLAVTGAIEGAHLALVGKRRRGERAGPVRAQRMRPAGPARSAPR